MVSKVFEHPFDLTKVRLQSQVLDDAPRFSGPIDCLTKTWKNEGIRGLYRVGNDFSQIPSIISDNLYIISTQLLYDPYANIAWLCMILVAPPCRCTVILNKGFACTSSWCYGRKRIVIFMLQSNTSFNTDFDWYAARPTAIPRTFGHRRRWGRGRCEFPFVGSPHLSFLIFVILSYFFGIGPR